MNTLITLHSNGAAPQRFVAIALIAWSSTTQSQVRALYVSSRLTEQPHAIRKNLAVIHSRG